MFFFLSRILPLASDRWLRVERLLVAWWWSSALPLRRCLPILALLDLVFKFKDQGSGIRDQGSWWSSFLSFWCLAPDLVLHLVLAATLALKSRSIKCIYEIFPPLVAILTQDVCDHKMSMKCLCNIALSDHGSYVESFNWTTFQMDLHYINI